MFKITDSAAKDLIAHPQCKEALVRLHALHSRYMDTEFLLFKYDDGDLWEFAITSMANPNHIHLRGGLLWRDEQWSIHT